MTAKCSTVAGAQGMIPCVPRQKETVLRRVRTMCSTLTWHHQSSGLHNARQQLRNNQLLRQR